MPATPPRPQPGLSDDISESFHQLQLALERFRQTLGAAPMQSMSRLAALAQLQVLIRRFPVEARRMLNDLDQPHTGDGYQRTDGTSS